MQENNIDDMRRTSFEDLPFELHSDNMTWIEWHCAIESHEFLTQVTPAFINDKLNLWGLSNQFE